VDAVNDTDALRDVLSDLVEVNSRFVQAIRRIARVNGSGDSVATWRTLGVLKRNGAIRVGVLAEASQVAQPTMTKLVAGLVERGWAERLPDVADARAWQIGITAAGETALLEWRAGLASVLLPHFTDLDQRDLDALRRTVALLDRHIAGFEPADLQEVAS
jgi:DNA-binding MarR family transcriptional regulator